MQFRKRDLANKEIIGELSKKLKVLEFVTLLAKCEANWGGVKVIY